MKRELFAPHREQRPEDELAALSVSDHPDVRAATEAAEAAAIVLQAANAAFAEITAGIENADVLVRRRARLQQLAVEERLAEAELEMEQARRAVAAVRGRVRGEIKPRIAAIYEQLVAELDGALERAAEVNARLTAVLVKAGEVLGHGHGLPELLWHELESPTPTKDSRLDAWRRSARQHGFAVRGDG